MTLSDRINSDMKDAMRARDSERLGAIRMLRAAILEHEKSGKGELTDEDTVSIVQRLVKQRRDAARQFEEAGRDDLAAKETAEVGVLEVYLPAQLSDREIEDTVRSVIKQTGATGPKDMGRVMGPAMAAMRGQADGNRVRGVVQALLNG